MNTIPALSSTLPAGTSHLAMREWIAGHETLLASYLLTRAVPALGGDAICGLFVSRAENGDYLLRLCAGSDNRCMVWVDECRTASHFGRGYADALAQAWIARLETNAWRLDWSAHNSSGDPTFSLLSVAA